MPHSMQRVSGHCPKCQKNVPCFIMSTGMGGANMLVPDQCPECQTDLTMPEVQFDLETEIERHGGRIY